MAAAKTRTLNDYLDRIQKKLPNWLARIMEWSRQPTLIWVRVPVAVLLIAAGCVGFLPILGFWMVPLGLLLLAQDIQWLQRPLVTALQWSEKRWRQYKGR